LVISQLLQNSAEMWTFCGKHQILRLGSKFRGPRKTVGPNHHRRRLVFYAQICLTGYDTGIASLSLSVKYGRNLKTE